MIEVENRHWSLAAVAPDLLADRASQGLLPLFRDWPASERKLSALAADLAAADGKDCIAAPEDPSHILAPLLYPAKVICTGANYKDHVKEIGFADFNKSKARTPFFLKPPTTAIVGSGKSMRYPKGVTQYDWELELVVVIGRQASDVSAADALNYVAGYTIGLDMSARDRLFHPDNLSGMDVFGGKAFNGSCPTGPKFVPARFIPDPQNLAMKLHVNGTLKQNANTSQMVWTIAEQIEKISSVLTLEPGDMILTGTPSGAAYPHGPFLNVDDRIDAEIGHLGILHLQIAP